MKEGISELYRLLLDTEDLLAGGYKKVHPSFSEALRKFEDSFHIRKHAEEQQRSRKRQEPQSAKMQEQSTLSAEERRQELSALTKRIQSCEKCGLHLVRKNAVPGVGVMNPLVMVIGEAPGAQEDARGEPFVGPAGEYLDKWLAAIGLSRKQNVFIANIVKCRPPQNRDPNGTECETCLPFLYKQIDYIQPRLILTAGRISTRIITRSGQGILKIHGMLYTYNDIPGNSYLTSQCGIKKSCMAEDSMG